MNQLSAWIDLKQTDFAILPIGSLEQHGYHLPISTDSIIAEAVARELAKRFHHAFLLPTLPYSCSFEHAGFPGTISLRSATIIAIIQDIMESLERTGIRKCVIVNGHGGNMLLGNIAQEMNVDRPRILVTPNRKHWDQAYESAGISTTISNDMHAGEGETSILLYLLEEGIVQSDRMLDIDSPERDLLTVTGIKAYTKTGTIGFPTRANAKKGKALLQALTDQIYLTVKEFLNLGT